MKRIKEILKMFDTIKAPYFCSYQKLKECFREEIKKHHPDRMGDEEKAKEIITSFRELEKIYKNLETLEAYKRIYFSTINSSSAISEESPKIVKKLSISKKFIILAITTVITILVGDISLMFLAIVAVTIVLWGYEKV